MSEPSIFEPGDVGVHDLGEKGGRFAFTQRNGQPNQGLIWEHPKPDGSGLCEPGGIEFHPRGPWTVIQLEPLTLSPSLLCTACGRHGWIRHGLWEDCS